MEATLAPDSEQTSPCLPQHGTLSRRGSLTSILRSPPQLRQRHRSTFVAKAGAWFFLMFGVGLAGGVGLVAFAFGTPPQGAAPAPRVGSALGVMPVVGNSSQQLVVFGGRGQTGYMFQDLHTLRCGCVGKIEDVCRRRGGRPASAPVAPTPCRCLCLHRAA